MSLNWPAWFYTSASPRHLLKHCHQLVTSIYSSDDFLDPQTATLEPTSLQQPVRYLRSIGAIGSLTIIAYVVTLSLGDHGLSTASLWRWSTAMAVFMACFFLATSQPATLVGHKRSFWLTAAQTVLALYINLFLSGNVVSAAILLMVAAQIALLVPGWAMLLWVLLQSAGLFAIFHFYWNLQDALLYSAGFWYFQLFVATIMKIAVRENRARTQLNAVVKELRETRILLNNAAREAERLSISRELHDVMGHHLTAINMNLQVALYQHNADLIKRHMTRAQDASRLMMTDIRQAIHGLRDSTQRGLQAELTEIADLLPVTVHLSLPAQLETCCPVIKHILIRTVQEILTNAIRHGTAQQVWLNFQLSGHLLTLQAHDDGRGATNLRPGHGLSGMRERIESAGGHLEVRAQAGLGVALTIQLPLQGDL